MAFNVIPIPAQLAEEVRRTGRAPGFGHPAHVHVASEHGYGPCRLCLRRTRPGEVRTLFTYNPYREPGEVPVGGPIVIHAEACEPFSGPGFPEELRGLPMVFQGHRQGGAGLVNWWLEGREPEDLFEELFRDPQIVFLSIRNPEPGSACFIARIERT